MATARAEAPLPGEPGWVLAWFEQLDRQLPVFWKIQIANTAFLLAATWATAWAVERTPRTAVLTIGFGLLGALAAAVCSALLSRRALRPLERVVATMRAVEQGEEQARAQEDGDPWAFAVTRTLNAMLDRLAAQRRASAVAAMRAEDAERRRIARELHDDPCQRLARLTAALQDQPELARQAVDVLEGMRRSMAALHPAVLEDLGFSAALRWLADEADSPAVHVEIHAGPPEDPDVQHAVFRIAQEAVNNARRHAKADHVWLRWDLTGIAWQLQVEDDGQGMDRPTRPRITAGSELAHYGMRAMRSRAAAIDGALVWEVVPGGGTVVTLTCPAGRTAS